MKNLLFRIISRIIKKTRKHSASDSVEEEESEPWGKHRGIMEQ
jgi:hypothetical protein